MADPLGKKKENLWGKNVGNKRSQTPKLTGTIRAPPERTPRLIPKKTKQSGDEIIKDVHNKQDEARLH